MGFEHEFTNIAGRIVKSFSKVFPGEGQSDR